MKIASESPDRNRVYLQTERTGIYSAPSPVARPPEFRARPQAVLPTLQPPGGWELPPPTQRLASLPRRSSSQSCAAQVAAERAAPSRGPQCCTQLPRHSHEKKETNEKRTDVEDRRENLGTPLDCGVCPFITPTGQSAEARGTERGRDRPPRPPPLHRHP